MFVSVILSLSECDQQCRPLIFVLSGTNLQYCPHTCKHILRGMPVKLLMYARNDACYSVSLVATGRNGEVSAAKPTNKLSHGRSWSLFLKFTMYQET